MANDNQMQDILAKLDEGVKSLFESDKYAEYLSVMSRFHNYSTRNTLLIFAQKPDSQRIAGYNSWKNNFNRQVKRGEHGIKILAPIPFNETKEFEKLDPDTKQPILDDRGQPVMETLMRMGARFKTVSVFDIAQTTGDPLPELAEPLTGDVERYELFMDALRAVSPLPIVFENLPSDVDGICHFGDRIAIREGMSQTQTVAAVIHELAHAKFHDRQTLDLEGKPKSKRLEETEAESIAFVVAAKYSVEIGANSFGYISSWQRDTEAKELQASLDTIRKAAGELINAIDERYQALAKERGIDLSVVTDELGEEANYNMIDGIINNVPPKQEPAPTAETLATEEALPNTPGWEDIPSNDRDLVARIQGYVQSVGKAMDVTDNEIYQAVLNWREHEQGVFWDTYRSIGDAILNERTLAEVRSQHEEATPIDVAPIHEKLSMLSELPDMDAKHAYAAEVLIEALCQNAELLAFANAGGDWQSGGGRYAVFDGGYYEKLIDMLRSELVELLDDKARANRLENAVKGNVNRRLSDIAYDRATLDEYAEIAQSGRLEIYLTPYPENSETTGVQVHLTELLSDGGKHDYGIIFGYDPGDTRDHAINNYLSAKDFNMFRESVFGKPETSVTLTYKETEPVGSTVLRRLLFNDMNFNRELKRTRVEVLPPMGKYSVYAQHLSGVIGDDTTIHIGTDSGYLLPLNVDRTNFEKRYFESFIDRMFEKAGAQLDAQLATPEKFAMYQQAAITGRIDEAETHNAVYKTFKAEKDGERRAEIAAQQAAAKQETVQKHVEEIKSNAEIIASGGKFEVVTSQYSGKNNLLELFALYGIDVPLATKGWFNNKLVRFEVTANGGYSYSSYQNKGRRTSYMGNAAHSKLNELRKAVQATPIAEKLAQKGLLDAAETANPILSAEPAKTEVKKGVENKLYEHFAALYPQIASGEYSYMKLERDGFDPVSLECIGENRVSVMHTYTMNGDLMYDPMMTFDLDREARTMTAHEFEQSMPPLYQRVTEPNGDGQSVDGNGRESTVRNLQGKLNEFAATWFDNLEQQGHIPVRATLAGLDENALVTFTADGEPIMPEPAAVETPQEPGVTLPDPSVTLAEMAEYGYTDTTAMFPLSTERAVELFESQNLVYLLYPDGTEAMPWSVDEIKVHDGLCGIECADWERIQAAEKPVVGENSRESELLHGDKNLFGIYQIRDDIDEPRDFRFANMRELEAHGLTVDRTNYELVYTGELPIRDTQTNLHRLFKVFQHDSAECPQNFTARSMSVSDVIVLQWRGEVSAHFVDSAGFAELPAFTGEERRQPATPDKTAAEPTLYHVDKRSDDATPTAPTVAAPGNTVKSGGSISLTDLAKATHAEQPRPPAQKSKPDLLAKIAANKQRIASQQPAQKSIQRGGKDDDRTIHG
ncbi:hypothetical protein FACS1894202_03790 [Clostridia bacterium]|nr:hypothetical protein FACS1894202_03790 [Clostridia bacterium]